MIQLPWASAVADSTGQLCVHDPVLIIDANRRCWVIKCRLCRRDHRDWMLLEAIRLSSSRDRDGERMTDSQAQQEETDHPRQPLDSSRQPAKHCSAFAFSMIRTIESRPSCRMNRICRSNGHRPRYRRIRRGMGIHTLAIRHLRLLSTERRLETFPGATETSGSGCGNRRLSANPRLLAQWMCHLERVLPTSARPASGTALAETPAGPISLAEFPLRPVRSGVRSTTERRSQG